MHGCPGWGGGSVGRGGAGPTWTLMSIVTMGLLFSWCGSMHSNQLKGHEKKNVFLTSSNELNMCQVSNMFNLQTVKARARFVIHSTRFRSPNLLSVRQKKKIRLNVSFGCFAIILELVYGKQNIIETCFFSKQVGFMTASGWHAASARWSKISFPSERNPFFFSRFLLFYH